MRDVTGELRELAAKIAQMAVRAGADDAEVQVSDGSELEAKVRLGEPEFVHEAGSRGLGLRVFRDLRQAVTYTSDLRPHALERFVADTIELAKLGEPNELHRLADAEDFASKIPDLELYDVASESLDAATAIELCKRGERAALDYDKRVTNSEGATYGRVLGATAFANSAGFAGAYRGSYSSLSVVPLCDDEGGKKRRGAWWTGNRYADKLEEPEAVGREAARRTMEQLGSRKVDTCECPIVFDKEVGRAIVGMVFSVANGASFYRKSSYLIGREGTEIASPLVTIEDDPLVLRAPGSRPFDGDGLATRKNVLVERGVLGSVLCDVYTARKLGRKSNGAAGRGTGSTPGQPPPTSS